MFGRLLRSLIALGAVLVAFQAYAWLVSPWVEPPVVARVREAILIDNLSEPRSSVRRYQEEVLAAYLPSGHWALGGSPKVLESGAVMLVIDNYRRDDTGRVDLTRCLLLMFPTRRTAERPAPADALVFDAPGGARLQFDENFQPSRGKVGRVIGGQFPGDVVIRSRMADPGPGDDLLITARDLRMNETMVFSPHEVDLRYGPNRGAGRRLEIKLLEDVDARGGGLKIAGVESIEVFHDVRLELQLGGANPLGGVAVLPGRPLPTPKRLAGGGGIELTAFAAGAPSDEAAAWADGPELTPPRQSIYTPPAAARQGRSPAAPAPPTDPPSSPPVEITCGGSFRLDLTDFTATMRDGVHVQQPTTRGQNDQLTCQQLVIAFNAGEGGTPLVIDPRNDPNVADRQRRALGRLDPRRLVATGSPVKVDSPSRGVVARGRRLEFDFRTRQLSLDGPRAVISRGGSFVQAPTIRYEHPADGADVAIGRMWLGGPGRLRAAPDAGRNARGDAGDARDTINARWGKVEGVEFPVSLTRDAQDHPMLTVLGRPQLTVDGAAGGAVDRTGEMVSDRLVVRMQETAADGPDGPAIELGRGDRLALLPERVDASGRVRVESPRLSAATDELTVFLLAGLTPQPRGQPAAAPPQPTTASTQAPPAGQQPGQRSGQPSRSAAKPKTRYQLAARRAKIDVMLRGREAAPATVTCEGAVDFREQNPKPGEQPLAATGARLRVDGLETDAVRLTIHGAPAGADRSPGGGAGLATIAARGMTLHARDAHLDQANTRLWAAAPGAAHWRTDRDLLGQQTAAATDLFLRWRDGWVFDGKQITVRGDVLGQGPHDWVRAGELIATLDRPMNFGRGAGGGVGSGSAPVEVRQIDCLGGVTIDHRTVDAGGQTSHERAELATLSINQQTGAITGTGPGSVRSVRLTDGANPLAAIAGGSPTPPAAADNPARLGLLRVRFQGGVVGNYKNRQIEFRNRVRAVYGPVIAWQQELPLEATGPLRPDSATLACNVLQVAEDPLARYQSPLAGPAATSRRLGPLELIAQGGVRLEGASRGGGSFNAVASQASYSQAKELFVLRGDALAKASLWVQQSPTEGRLKHTSAELSYWRKTGVVQTKNFGASGYTPTAGRPAARPR
ncbi:MAG: hypothetical protein AAF790_08140 [Planctomycetota bacterium]